MPQVHLRRAQRHASQHGGYDFEQEILAISASETQRSSAASQTACRYLIGLQTDSGICLMLGRIASVLATVMENCTPGASRQAGLDQLGREERRVGANQDPGGIPAERRVLIASASREAAPRPEPALPTRSALPGISSVDRGTKPAAAA